MININGRNVLISSLMHVPIHFVMSLEDLDFLIVFKFLQTFTYLSSPCVCLLLNTFPVEDLTSGSVTFVIPLAPSGSIFSRNSWLKKWALIRFRVNFVLTFLISSYLSILFSFSYTVFLFYAFLISSIISFVLLPPFGFFSTSPLFYHLLPPWTPK